MNILINGFEINLVKINGGSFLMGAYENDLYAPEDESPQHKVSLSPFYIMESLVTQDIWVSIMGTNPSVSKGDKLPVEAVTYNDSQTFISKINSITGLKFSLPSEAQWEFVASSGGQLIDPFVDESSNNQFGIKDINNKGIFEWCIDWYGKYNKEYQTNPLGPELGELKVLRGGVCYWPKTLRISNRNYDYPDSECDLNGPCYSFRLVLNDFPKEDTSASRRERAFAKIQRPFIISQDGKKLIKCGEVQNATIPKGIEIICDGAFQTDDFFANTDLREVIIASSIRCIGNHVFEGCHNLTTILLPDGLTQIGDKAFAYTNVKKFVIPKSLIYLGINPFASIENIEIQCPEGSIFKIKNGLLYNSLSKESISLCHDMDVLEINENVELLNEFSFGGKRINKLIIPPHIKEIRHGALVGATIKEIVTNNQNYKVENDCLLSYDGKKLIAFYGQTESCIIPNGVEEICKFAFRSSRVKNILFPNTVKIIGEKAFMFCEHLTLYIDSIIQIAKDAFLQRPYGLFTVSEVSIPVDYKDFYCTPYTFSCQTNQLKIKYRHNEPTD